MSADVNLEQMKDNITVGIVKDSKNTIIKSPFYEKKRDTNSDCEPEIKRSLLGFEDVEDVVGVPRQLVEDNPHLLQALRQRVDTVEGGQRGGGGGACSALRMSRMSLASLGNWSRTTFTSFKP
ncbi:uncharacterized protein A4U43_C01F17780 [Asparagus officinalis]|uniref:Uncharacterized protein n=1 Tax=Asparagus officinalis TaxID=4686 RepID=A0A5P1FQZ7_ASPOF|nr:uncharacterized protein A4U43_C01F17780 [Asparagus officinalis]